MANRSRERRDKTRPRRTAPTLAEWLRTYIGGRLDVNESTRRNYRETERELLDFFGGEIQIDRITATQAEGFYAWLRGTRKLANMSAALHCRRAKQFFAAANKRGIITQYPFAELRCPLGANSRPFYFVTRQEADAVLEVLPTAEWRLIFTLCRYGGLRCPSEVVGLRWQDIEGSLPPGSRGPVTLMRRGVMRGPTA